MRPVSRSSRRRPSRRRSRSPTTSCCSSREHHRSIRELKVRSSRSRPTQPDATTAHRRPRLARPRRPHHQQPEEAGHRPRIIEMTARCSASRSNRSSAVAVAGRLLTLASRHVRHPEHDRSLVPRHRKEFGARDHTTVMHACARSRAGWGSVSKSSTGSLSCNSGSTPPPEDHAGDSMSISGGRPGTVGLSTR